MLLEHAARRRHAAAECRFAAFAEHRTVSTLNSSRIAVDAITLRIYNRQMEFTWSDTKRTANVKAHGLDFVDAKSVFEGLTTLLKMTDFPTVSNVLSRWDCSLVSQFLSYTRRVTMKSALFRSEKQPSASRKSTSMQSKTDWAQL